MIEDKKLDLKMPENPEEQFWMKVKDQTEKQLFEWKHQMIIGEKIISLADSMLKVKPK